MLSEFISGFDEWLGSGIWLLGPTCFLSTGKRHLGVKPMQACVQITRFVFRLFLCCCQSLAFGVFGARSGSRTRVACLEGRGTAVELRAQKKSPRCAGTEGRTDARFDTAALRVIVARSARSALHPKEIPRCWSNEGGITEDRPSFRHLAEIFLKPQSVLALQRISDSFSHV